MRLKAFTLVVKDDAVLVIQEAAAKWNGKWSAPGGGVEPGETVADGARREALEESGCEVELQYVLMVERGGGFFNPKTTVYFLGRCIGGEPKTFADKESLQARWIRMEDVQRLPMRRQLRDMLKIYRSHSGFLPVDRLDLSNNGFPRL